MYAAVSVLIAAVNRDSNDADVSDDMPLLLAYVVPVSCTRLPPEMAKSGCRVLLFSSCETHALARHILLLPYSTGIITYTLIRQNQSRPG